MNLPKNQHWVPRSYLSHFATPETRLTERPKAWCFDKEKPGIGAHLRSVREVCASGYLYSPIGVDGQRDWSAEKMLDRIETAAGEYWHSLNTSQADLADPKVRLAVGSFVGAMQLRNISLFDLYNNAIRLRDKLYPLADHYEPVNGLDARDPGRLFAQKLQQDLARMTDVFLRKRWLVLRSDEELFVTSDRPLLFLREGARGGPGTPNTTAAFPLGPCSVLLMDDRTDEPANIYHPVKSDFARLVNVQVWQHCLRHTITGRSPGDVAHEIGLGAEQPLG